MRVLSVASCVLLALASPAGAAEIQATAATLQKVWAATKPGDTIKLQGPFGLAVLRGRSFDPPVTIDASRANFSAVILGGVSGVTWKGGAIASVDTRPGVSVGDSQSVRLEGLHYRGTGAAVGVYFANSRDVELSRSQFLRPKNGVTVQNVQGFRLIDNTITGWSADGVGLMGNTGGLIKGNTFLDPIKLDPNTHMDAIQGYFAPVANRDILITENTIRGADTQGIFMPQAKGYPPPENIRIVANVIATANAPNGIILQNDKSGEVSRNRVSTLPGSKWQTVVQASPGVPSRCGNTADSYGSWRAATEKACK